MSDFNLGDFLGLIIVFVIYLSAASGKKKKGKQKRRSPMRSRVQGEQRDVRTKARNAQTQAGFGNAFDQTSKPDAKAQDRCETRQIHLHEVTQQQFAYAGEGEDPCHAGGYSALEEEESAFTKAEDAETLAQDVLRGVIMSEILTRPQERAALRRGRR